VDHFGSFCEATINQLVAPARKWYRRPILPDYVKLL
jgi:hypothetical protein